MTTRTFLGRAVRRTDPLLAAMVGWTGLAVLLFVVFRGDTTRQVQIFWVFQPPLDVVLVACAWRVQRIAAGRVRLFWRVVVGFGALFLFGDTWQTVLTFVRPGQMSTTGDLVQTTCLAAGQITVVIVMLTHPHASRTGRARLALWLDSAAVLVGGAVLSWCFAIAPAGVTRADAFATVAETGVALVAAFAAVKMVLTGNAPMHKIAAAPMIAAAIVMGGGVFLVSAGSTVLSPATYALLLLPSLLIASGPRVQQLVARVDESPFGTRRRKPYSLMPYASIAVAFGALITILPQGVSLRLWGVMAGVILVTGLVAARQLIAFQDNVQLIGRLDATLGELREHEGRLRDQALFDSLTRLANRNHFGDEVARMLAARAPGATVTLLLIDLDDFKMVNDTMGHAAGDQLLVTVADRLRHTIRDGDAVARLGGDEFAVLLREVHGDDAESTARRLLTELAAPIRVLQNDVVVRASIGMADAEAGDTLESLLRDADIAMYAAKDQGKGNWVRYVPEMGERILRSAEVTRRLGDAVAAGQFHLDYQPIFRIGTGELTGTEALVRWRPDPNRPSILPTEFIPVAEDSGLIVPIGRWVLHEACRQAGEWRRRHPAAAAQVMSVNVAGRQLREPGFVAEVADALAAAGLPAACLTIEVTETAVVDDDAAIATLHALRGLGVRLALDDFGTAASSLGLLLTCPVTTLKLDRSFVEGVTTVDRQRAVATAVSQIADALDLTSVAEGIETPEQARLLEELGYDLAQGYLFSRPLPADEMGRLWAEGARAQAALR